MRRGEIARGNMSLAMRTPHGTPGDAPTVDAGVARRDHGAMAEGTRASSMPPAAQSPTVPPRSGVVASTLARENAEEVEVAPITDAELRRLMLTGEWPARFARGR
jgi:hypothetical protein